jgi:hypothetical protein
MQIGYSPLPREARIEAATVIVRCTIETASFGSERTLTRAGRERSIPGATRQSERDRQRSEVQDASARSRRVAVD